MPDYLEMARRALVVAEGAGQPAGERALAWLNLAGVRLLKVEGVLTIAVPSDRNGPEVQAALRTLRLDRLPFGPWRARSPCHGRQQEPRQTWRRVFRGAAGSPRS